MQPIHALIIGEDAEAAAAAKAAEEEQQDADEDKRQEECFNKALDHVQESQPSKRTSSARRESAVLQISFSKQK